MKKSKLALFQSVISLLLCVTMLIGTTFAWFTDSVTSSGNIIKSGKLDIEMLWANGTEDPETAEWKDASQGAIFDYSLWEPGYTEVRHIKIQNKGTLALKYQLQIVANGEVSKLADVIDVYYNDPAVQITDRSMLTDSNKLGTLTEALGGMATTANGSLKAEEEITLTIALKMQETAGNEYQNLSIGSDFSVILLATQEQYESDSFGTGYDKDATFKFPENTISVNVSGDVTVENGKVKEDTTLSGSAASAQIPAGVQLAENTDKLTLSISEMERSGTNIVLGENESMRPLNVHVEGIAADNTVPMEIYIKEAAGKGLNAGNLKLYHVENGTSNQMELVDTFTAHNQFKYDPATGDVTLYMATFSEVALVADTVNAWNGTVATAFAGGEGKEENPYLIANADQLVYMGDLISNENENYGDKHYKLIADINLGGEGNANNSILFYPIGYHKVGGTVATVGVDDAPEATYIIEEDTKTPGSAVADNGTTNWYTYGGAFKGTFDGAGHKISNIYQNTWQLKGNYDGNYWNAAMGLFGYVYGGTVKNLTVHNFQSDGEFTPTGVIAAYAVNSTFENIAITECNPRVYNTGNGGIVGIGGNSDDPDTYKLTFKNITIDNSNIISALWGSWDVACGGLVGMFRGAGHVYMTNCHVAAQIDVYNDVCGNYQYYWYRYAGMMVGTNKNMVTDKDGYTVPETSKFHAENCTVHFGEWNDYYYCELVANSLASYTHDHQFSRLEQISSLDEIKSGDTWTKTGNFLLISGDTKTCYHIVNKNGTLMQHLHTDAGEETVNGKTVLKEDNQIIYLPFNQLFTGYGWGVKHVPVYNGEDYAFEGITILDREVADSVDKFETKFTGDFLYRVGNQNTVSVGSLFAAKAGATINNSGVVVTIDKVDENSNVSGTFTANTTDWTKGTIQFSGTGVVKVTIQDYNFCKPTVLYLEVVDAVNATSATNAKSNNVVLLDNCGFSSLEVSGGYTLYGNGFTMTCSSDSAALDMGYSFVTLNNGTLDNVQIVCPNFDYAVLYKSNMTESGNRSETTDRTRYYNVKSGVMASGNSQILNSRISGGRAAVNVSGGNVVIDNSRIELGAVASVLVGAANSLTLRNVTLVQKPTASTHDSSKTLMGFSVLVICNADGSSATINLDGNLVQNAWVDESDKQYVPSAGQDIIADAMKQMDYLHDLDGDGTKESLNLGIAYMPQSAPGKVDTTNIKDNRNNKNAVPYDYASVSTTKVYSYKNTNGTDDSVKTESSYNPNTQSDIVMVVYADTKDGVTTGKSYGTDGWVYELNVDLDKASGYALDFSKLSMVVNNVAITDFKVDGSVKPTSVAVTAGGTIYTLTATVNGKEYTAIFKVTGTETTKESPSLVASNYAAALLVGEAGGTLSKDTWHGAAPALEGIQIKYWSVAEKQYKTVKLSDYTPATVGKQNGANTTWTYSPANGDFTLTITGGQVHSSNNVSAIPVVCGGKLYFVAATSSGLVNYGNSARTIPVSYSFKDNNGGTELTFSYTWSIECPDKATAYDYSDFMNGISKTFTIKSSNGNVCVTGDTLVTLADGTQKRIDQVTYADHLLVWNFYTGEYAVAPSALIQNHGYAWNNIIMLTFSDGTVTKAINEHGYFDATINEFVMVTPDNAADYIGHKFVKADGDAYTTVTLADVAVHEEYIKAYSILSAYYYNFITDNMFSLTSPVIETNFFMPFVVGENMTFDAEKMAENIEMYGLYEYADFEGKIPYEVFECLNIKYLKVAVGKGLVTYDQIIELLNSEGVI